jgi:hypothetical protein
MVPTGQVLRRRALMRRVCSVHAGCLTTCQAPERLTMDGERQPAGRSGALAFVLIVASGEKAALTRLSHRQRCMTVTGTVVPLAGFEHSNEWRPAMAFTLESPAFRNGGEIPRKYARSGENVSPPLTWKDVPSGTKSLALVVEDRMLLPALFATGAYMTSLRSGRSCWKGPQRVRRPKSSVMA